MTKDRGPSAKVIQWIINLLFLVLLFPILYHFEEIFDIIRSRI